MTPSLREFPSGAGPSSLAFATCGDSFVGLRAVDDNGSREGRLR